MAHRAEEKERRRQERIAQEEAARKAAARKRTLQVGGGVVLGLAVIAVVAIVALAGGGGSKDKTADISKLTADAKAAGCTFSQFKSEGRNHTASKVTYKTNPPTSGNHNPTPAQDGIYRAGNSPPKENFVHTLEHGRIEFQYKPGTPAADVAKLRRAGRGALQRHLRLPRPALRERHEHAGPVRRDGMDEVDHLPDPLHAGDRGHARVPPGLHRQGPRVHPLGRLGPRPRRGPGALAVAFGDASFTFRLEARPDMAKQPRILVGQVAAITGAARGIGKATAQAFAHEGMKVAIGDLDAELAEQAAAEMGPNAAGFALDVTRRDSFEAFIDAAEERFGPLDVLVNNAGIMPLGRFIDEDEATAVRMVDINLHGVIHGMKLALPRMMARNRGHVVNIASQAGKYGAPGGATYSATKHAVIGLTEAVRGELHIEGSAGRAELRHAVRRQDRAGRRAPRTRGG